MSVFSVVMFLIPPVAIFLQSITLCAATKRVQLPQRL